jgi:hypothetical protein
MKVRIAKVIYTTFGMHYNPKLDERKSGIQHPDHVEVTLGMRRQI